MDQSGKILKQLNNLLVMNYEIEKMYNEALKTVFAKTLKTFFKERGFERQEFGNELRLEIEELGGNPKHSGPMDSTLYKIWMRFKNSLVLKNESHVLDDVYSVKQLSLDQYNHLLREMNLPLSVCKILAKQRDTVEASMHAITRQDVYVA